jgi:hypothetical protein
VNKLKIALILSSVITTQAFAQATWDITPYETKKISGVLTIQELKVGDSYRSALIMGVCTGESGDIYANPDMRVEGGGRFIVKKTSKNSISLEFLEKNHPPKAQISMLTNSHIHEPCSDEWRSSNLFKVVSIEGKQSIKALLVK